MKVGDSGDNYKIKFIFKTKENDLAGFTTFYSQKDMVYGDAVFNSMIPCALNEIRFLLKSLWVSSQTLFVGIDTNVLHSSQDFQIPVNFL